MHETRTCAGRAAASERIRHLIAGPCRSGRVIGAFRSAVYVAVDVGPGAAGESPGAVEIVAVETSDGLGLPCAATVTMPSSGLPLGTIRAGDDAQLGERRLDVGPLFFDVVRWWSPRRPRAVAVLPHHGTRLAAVSRLLPALPAEVDAALAGLTSALAPTGLGDLQDAAAALLGLGAGLTPQGDDVLAGVLVSLAAGRPTQPVARRLGDIVASQAVTRTTTLSAALLREAAAGFALPALVDLIDALHPTDRAGRAGMQRTRPDAVVRLLAVGHTSGAALAHGAVAAARLHAAMAPGDGPARLAVA